RSANEFVAYGNTRDVVINEWYSSGQFRFATEFVELFHGGSLPATLEGLSLEVDSAEYRFSQNSYIDANGFVTLARNPEGLLSGGVEINLQSESGFSSIKLEDELGQLDRVIGNNEDVAHSWGRSPDGSSKVEALAIP